MDNNSITPIGVKAPRSFCGTGKLGNVVLSKKKEVKVYEELSSGIGSFNVSCDIFVDWLQSIATAGEASSGEGSAWSTGSARSASARKEIGRDIGGIASPRGYTL